MVYWRRWTFGILAVLPAAALLLAACSGDDDGGSSNNTAAGTGTDQEYVATLCKAANDFQAELEKAFTNDDNDSEDAAKALAGPFEDFADAVRDANPPSDLKDWHEQVVASLDSLVKTMKSGDESAILQSLDENPFEDPPAGAAARIEKVAESNKDCKASGFTFGNDSTGQG